MPKAHIDSKGVITLIDAGKPEDVLHAEEGLHRLIVALTRMAIAQESLRADPDLNTTRSETPA